MKCPVCKDVTLLMTDKKWVEVDYCPECRWIWLDRWELEKLIELEKTTYSPNVNNVKSEYVRKEDDSYKSKNYHNEHKKNSIFDMFDF